MELDMTSVVMALVVLWLVGARIKKTLNKCFDYSDKVLDASTAELDAELELKLAKMNSNKEEL